MNLRPFILFLVFSTTFVPAAAQSQESPSFPIDELLEYLEVEPGHAEAGTVFYIGDPVGRNMTTFTSEAPLEDIVGISNKIVGYAVFDPENPERGGAGKFAVPVATLDTGIPLRDSHLAGADWLDAVKHPFIEFRIHRVTGIDKVKETDEFQTFDATLVGDFSLHGKSKRIEVPARVTSLVESEKTRKRLPGDLLAGRAEFQVALADFGVTGPAGMGVIGSKVGETIEIEVRFTGSTHKPDLGRLRESLEAGN
jgi:polyisoprenoid-binding protein YceI